MTFNKNTSNLEVCSNLFLLFIKTNKQANNTLVSIANFLFQDTFSKVLQSKISKPSHGLYFIWCNWWRTKQRRSSDEKTTTTTTTTKNSATESNLQALVLSSELKWPLWAKAKLQEKINTVQILLHRLDSLTVGTWLVLTGNPFFTMLHRTTLNIYQTVRQVILHSFLWWFNSFVEGN